MRVSSLEYPPGPFADLFRGLRAAGTLSLIRGCSVYDAPHLFAIYREQLGRPLTQASAGAVAAALARKYERDGYSRPELQIDERPMAAGILRIEVFEARFTRVTLSGPAGPYQQRLAALGAQIRDGNPVRPAQVQRALQQMRVLPGLSVNAATAQDETVRNGFVLTIKTTYQRAEALVRISNRGSREVGPVFVDGQGLVNDLLGKDEKLGALFTAATDFAEYHAAGGFAEVPVGARGMHVSLFGLHSSSTPLPSPLYPGDSYTRTLAMPSVTRPLPVDASSVAIAAGLDVDNQLTDRAGAVLRDDRLRVADLNPPPAPVIRRRRMFIGDYLEAAGAVGGGVAGLAGAASEFQVSRMIIHFPPSFLWNTVRTFPTSTVAPDLSVTV